MPAPAASRARCWNVPNAWRAPAPRESVIVTPWKWSCSRSWPWTMVDDNPAGRPASSAGYTAQDTMTSRTPAAIAALYGNSSIVRERLPRHVQGDRPRVGVLRGRGRAQAGEVLGSGRDTHLLLRLDEVRA